MTLTAFLDRFAADHEFGIASSTMVRMRAAIGAYRAFLLTEPTLEHFRPDDFNRFCDFTREHRASDTYRTTRGSLLTLWRAAADAGLVPSPSNVRKFRSRRRSPVTWTPDELIQLIETAKQLEGRFRETNLRKDLFFSSILMVGYDTALRLGDLLALPVGAFNDSVTNVVVSKTGNAVVRKLSRESRVALEACERDRERELIWPLWGRREVFYYAFRRLVLQAGVRPFTFRCVRRTSVTWKDIDQPGSGTALADHRSRATTVESYLDVSQSRSMIPRPPALQDAADRWRRERALDS